MPRIENCKKCKGTGRSRAGDCSFCKGSGRVVLSADENGKTVIVPAAKK